MRNGKESEMLMLSMLKGIENEIQTNSTNLLNVFFMHVLCVKSENK